MIKMKEEGNRRVYEAWFTDGPAVLESDLVWGLHEGRILIPARDFEALAAPAENGLRLDNARVRQLRKGEHAFYIDGEIWAVKALDAASEDCAVLLRAAVVKRRRTHARKVEQARSIVQSGEDAREIAEFRRIGIPDDVKMFVWQRDGGRCVSCGSNRELEFDHIIPLSMGGSNTSRNLQLLCSPCNLAKGGNLV